jgi:hypothetical protein
MIHYLLQKALYLVLEVITDLQHVVALSREILSFGFQFILQLPLLSAAFVSGEPTALKTPPPLLFGAQIRWFPASPPPRLQQFFVGDTALGPLGFLFPCQ